MKKIIYLLSVILLVSCAQEGKKASNAEVSGEIQNKWESKMMETESTLYLVKEDGKLLMKTVYKEDGSQTVEEVTETIEGKTTRYDYEEGDGDYYLLEANGDLGMYDEEGVFNTCKKVE
jgi:hypothetical protein